MRRSLLTFAVLAATLVAASPNSGGELVPAGAVTPNFGGLEAPIRPGSNMTSPGGCTFNFVFHQVVVPTDEDPNPVSDVYIGTAAHCTDEIGETVHHGSAGPIGTTVFDSDEDGPTGLDFSLIRLFPSQVANTNPVMLGNDGPHRAITAADLARGDIVDVYGYGMVVGNNAATRDRFGALVNFDAREYVIDMPAVNGDSGGPILHRDTGAALGIVSRYGFAATPPSTDQGPLMTWIREELDRAGYTDVILTTVDFAPAA